jgi:hypothetical protein
MNEETRENCTDLVHVLRARHALRAQILAHLSKNLIQTFCELTLNVLYGDLHISAEEKKILIKHKTLCEKLSKDRRSWRRKLALVNSTPAELLDTLAQILQKYV